MATGSPRDERQQYLLLLATVVLTTLLVFLFCVFWNFPELSLSDFFAVWLTKAFRNLWLAMVVMVPAFLICQQGLFIRTQRLNLNPTGAVHKGGDKDAADRNMEEANLEAAKQFGLPAIAVDYFLPAFLSALAGGVVGFALSTIKNNRGSLGELPLAEQEVYSGVVLGAIGAYVYVVINLAQRAFRRDITPGIAAWSAAHVVLGPVLGGFVAAVWQPEPSGYARQLLYFFAGLAPREIVSFIQNMIQRSIAGAQSQQAPGKIIPLQTIRGIDQFVADRLMEEGITDGYQLAMVNPIRLCRNTPYDLRQILAWMDECLLIATLPDYAEELRKAGVTGAVALAHFFRSNDALADVKPLADKIGLDATLLREVVWELAENGQQQRVFALRQSQEAESAK